MLWQITGFPSFLRLNNIPLCVIHSSINGHLGCFYLLAIVNDAAITIGVQIFLGDPAFNSFGYISKSGTAGSYGNFIFNFLRNCYIIFHSGCTILHSYQECTRVPFFSHPRQHLFSVSF